MNTKKLITLDQGVANALNFFIKNRPPRLKLIKNGIPMIIGSGNAYNTGRIIFSKQPALFFDESTFKVATQQYQALIKKGFSKRAIIISASGEKDAVWEIELAKKIGLKTTLLTCSADSPAAKVADKTLLYDKIPEPYTYNISTYLGMILSATQEKPKKILSYIKKIKLPKSFPQYSAYTFILPDEYSNIAPMLDIKRNELFGSKLSIRAFTYGNARHAKFVIPNEKELVISLGKNKYFGDKKNRWEINIPQKVNSAFVIALTYYLIGKIQATKPPYFKKNIASYCQEGVKAYGKTKPFPIIVE